MLILRVPNGLNILNMKPSETLSLHKKSQSAKISLPTSVCDATTFAKHQRLTRWELTIKSCLYCVWFMKKAQFLINFKHALGHTKS